MPDEIESEAERLVEEALEAGILRQNGPHFYATQEEEEDEHIGQGHEAALNWLEEEGYVEDVPEEEVQETETETQKSEEGPESGEEEAASAETDDEVPPDQETPSGGIYRHEGDEMVTFEREGRADGMLFPGGTYQDLPMKNDDIQHLIGEGILVDISG